VNKTSDDFLKTFYSEFKEFILHCEKLFSGDSNNNEVLVPPTEISSISSNSSFKKEGLNDKPFEFSNVREDIKRKELFFYLIIFTTKGPYFRKGLNYFIFFLFYFIFFF
jgi:hypothetical protein